MKQLVVTLFLFLSHFIFSQKITVFNAETGKPIESVVVYNKEKTKSAISNEDGIIDASDFSENELLIFSHVTYSEHQVKKKIILANNYHVYLSKHSEQLDEVILSVFRIKEKRSRVAEQIELITSKDIAKISPQTSADLLTNIPGIKVQKSQFGGGSPVLRGMESNRVLLVVDGVRMNNAIYRKGHLQNSITVSPNLLDRTEVIFGPSSVVYGSDALGGVIHYYTKTPKLSEYDSEFKSSLFSRYSSVNNEITNTISAELRFKKWASFTSISHSNFQDLSMGKNRSHGFENWGKVPFYSENTKGNFKIDQTVNENQNLQRNTGYNQTDVLQKFYVSLSKRTDLNVNVQYATSSDIPRFDRLTDIRNGTLNFAEWYYGPQNRLLISPQLEINPRKKWLESGEITLAYQNIKESRIQRRFGSLNRSVREENVNVYSINGDFEVPLAKRRNLEYGFEMVYNDVNSNAHGQILNIVDGEVQGYSGTFPVQSRYADGGSTYFSSALYLGFRQDINRKSTLNTGVRLTNTHLRAKWIDEQFFKLPDNEISLKNTALTATIGYVYRPSQTWQLNAVLSSGFRSPNIDDVGKVREKNGNVTVPNIYLQPEYAYNSEIGIQKYFNDRKFQIGANVYYTLLRSYIYRDAFTLDGKSSIEYDGVEGNIIANVNEENAYVTGFTLSYEGKLHENWTTSGFITYTKGESYDLKEPLSSIPPLFGNFELNYNNTKFECGANLVFNAKKDIKDYNITEGIDNHEQTPIVNPDAKEDVDKYFGSPSWMTVGLFGRYSISDYLSLQVNFSNLFDEHYKEFASGISAPGRNFSIALQVNL